jgi:hypothetical protein
MYSSVEPKRTGFPALLYRAGSGQSHESGLTHKWQLHSGPIPQSGRGTYSRKYSPVTARHIPRPPATERFFLFFSLAGHRLPQRLICKVNTNRQEVSRPSSGSNRLLNIKSCSTNPITRIEFLSQG